MIFDVVGNRAVWVARLFTWPKSKVLQFDTTNIFFMIQEMEAWILSQIDKIEEFGKNERLIRKRDNRVVRK